MGKGSGAGYLFREVSWRYRKRTCSRHGNALWIKVIKSKCCFRYNIYRSVLVALTSSFLLYPDWPDAVSACETCLTSLCCGTRSGSSASKTKVSCFITSKPAPPSLLLLVVWHLSWDVTRWLSTCCRFLLATFLHEKTEHRVDCCRRKVQSRF